LEIKNFKKKDEIMNTFILTLLIGIIAGIVDVLPMIKMKLDKYAISSAFTFYLIMPFIIYNINILQDIWWIKGGIITFVLSIPIMILVAKKDKSSIVPMAIMSFVIGTAIGIAGHYLSIY
jgi:hypothetical protein